MLTRDAFAVTLAIVASYGSALQPPAPDAFRTGIVHATQSTSQADAAGKSFFGVSDLYGESGRRFSPAERPRKKDMIGRKLRVTGVNYSEGKFANLRIYAEPGDPHGEVLSFLRHGDEIVCTGFKSIAGQTWVQHTVDETKQGLHKGEWPRPPYVGWSPQDIAGTRWLEFPEVLDGPQVGEEPKGEPGTVFELYAPPAPQPLEYDGVPGLYAPPDQTKNEIARAQIVKDHEKIIKAAQQRNTPAEFRTLGETSSLFDFASSRSRRSKTLEAFERIDDVIMGGVSSSALLEATSDVGVNFQGILRTEGGGFCGQRSKLFSAPLDLSAFKGLFIRCEGDEHVDERIFKVSLRTKQDTSEMVYSAEFAPPKGTVGTVLLPFSDFKMVRGPRLVPGAPPLNTAEIYQLSTLCTKFHIDADTTEMTGFRDGAFKLRIEEIGAYGASSPQLVIVPAPQSAKEQAKARPAKSKLMGPLFKLVFNEKARRRALASEKLTKRGQITSVLGRTMFAFRRQAANKGPVLALAILALNAGQATVAGALKQLLGVTRALAKLATSAKAPLSRKTNRRQNLPSLS